MEIFLIYSLVHNDADFYGQNLNPSGFLLLLNFKNKL